MKPNDLCLEMEKLEIINWVTGLKDDSAIEKLRMLRGNTRKKAGGSTSRRKKRMRLTKE